MPSRRERKKMRRRGKSPSDDEDNSEPEKEEKDESRDRGPIKAFYEDNYKKLLIIPFAILLAGFIVIGIQIATTGEFIAKDVSLSGGLTVNVLTEQDIDTSQLETQLQSEFPEASVRVRSLTELGTQVGVIIEASDINQDDLSNFLSGKIDNFEQNHSVEQIGPALGESFFRQTMISIGVAFLFMSLVVFYYFRTLAPSAAVVLAAFSDIVVTVGVMNVLGIRLSTAGIAALLMLIGYSVDTDILLSTRILKRKQDSLMERMYSAISTGLTMNITTMVALTVALIISQSQTISQIMTILLIGLAIDVVNTWIQNAGILRWYAEREGIS